MRVKALKNEIKDFDPVSIEITFESQLELDNFGKVFNNYYLSKAFKEIGINCEIWRVIRKIGGEVEKTDEISDIFREILNER